MEKMNQEIIQETAYALLQRMGFEASVEVTLESGLGEAFLCMLRVDTSQNLLIGQHGANLAALQHLIRVVLRKKIEKQVDIIVDINDYYSEKRTFLEKEAADASRAASLDRVAVILRPMLPYERKIVHTFLSLSTEVVSESVGKGDDRRVVVRPLLPESASPRSDGQFVIQ